MDEPEPDPHDLDAEGYNDAHQHAKDHDDLRAPDWQGDGSFGEQVGELIGMLHVITDRVRSLETRNHRNEQVLSRLARRNRTQNATATDDSTQPAKPAAWVWLEPPIPATLDPLSDPRAVVHNFVSFYNQIFVGVEGARSRAIPRCWPEHPGLAMEVTVLAYSWTLSHLGPEPSIRDSQHWYDRLRPAFAERLARDWLHSDCLDGTHRAGHIPPRRDRFTIAERNGTTQPGETGGTHPG